MVGPRSPREIVAHASGSTATIRGAGRSAPEHAADAADRAAGADAGDERVDAARSPSASRISCAVVSAWTRGFSGLSNWPGMNAPGVARADLAGLAAIAPSICSSGSVSTISAPYASSSWRRSRLMLAGIVSTQR